MNNSNIWPFDDTVLRNSLEANQNIASRGGHRRLSPERYVVMHKIFNFSPVHIHSPSHVKSFLISVKMCIIPVGNERLSEKDYSIYQINRLVQ